MYKTENPALRRICVYTLLLVLLASCAAPNTEKTFEYEHGSAKTTCTPLYNPDGTFAQSSCKTFCVLGNPNGIKTWIPASEDTEGGKYFEVLLPFENESQLEEFIEKEDGGRGEFSVCSSTIEFDNGLSCLYNELFVMQCTFVCSSGIPVNVDQETDKYSVDQYKGLTESDIQDKYCEPVSASSEATEEPTEASPPELPVPILTGDVTYCDLVSRSVNLRLVEGFTAEEFNHQVTMGGEAMSCKVNEGNSTLLTCTLPATTKFPASIQVSQDGSIVNEFEYNGSTCILPKGTAKPDNVVCDPVFLVDKICVPLE